MRDQRDITNPDIAKALAHPLRVRLLTLLEGQTASPSELAEAVGGELSLVSYHVRRLAAAGLIKLVRKRQRRGAVEHYYTAVPRTTITSEAWAQVPSIVKTAMASATLTEIGDQVNNAAAGGGFERGDAHLSRTSVTLDEQGWKQVARRLDSLMADLDKISEASAKRLKAKGAETAIESAVVLMLFEQIASAQAEAAAKDKQGARRGHAGRPAGAPAAR